MLQFGWILKFLETACFLPKLRATTLGFLPVTSNHLQMESPEQPCEEAALLSLYSRFPDGECSQAHTEAGIKALLPVITAFTAELKVWRMISIFC